MIMQATKNIIPEDWKQKPFSECVERTSIPREIKIPQNQYQKTGQYPIVDQGLDLVAGFTSDKIKLYKGNFPVVVFGDHTRIFKYVDFPFSLGADGTKLLCPKKFLEPRYFYFYLLQLPLESKGYNRHYKYLKEKNIVFPEKLEQKKIALVLLKLQQAITQQEQIIAKTKELKRSLMHRLFTYGLRGEELKETEIGLIPKSWKIKTIGEIAPFQGGFAFKSKDYKKSGIRLFKIANVSFGKALWEDVSFLPEEYLTQYSEYVLNEGDVVMAMTRPIITGGIKVSKITKTDSPCLLNQRVGRFKTASMIDPNYLYQFLFTSSFINHILYGAGGSQQPNISANKIGQCLISCPSIGEQKEIADLLSQTDIKIGVAEKKRNILQGLFKSLLQLLMTGQVRVKDIDFKDCG